VLHRLGGLGSTSDVQSQIVLAAQAAGVGPNPLGNPTAIVALHNWEHPYAERMPACRRSWRWMWRKRCMAK
jgi:hypothetical protein